MKIGTFLVALVLTLSVLGATAWFGLNKSAPLPAEQIADEPGSDGFVPPKVADSGPFPKAVPDSTDYDFGMMELGDTGRHTFIIRNEGEAPLVLKAGTTTCKCTISNVSDNTLMPGEQAEATLEWEPKQAEPSFEQRAEIWTNDPERVRIDLTVFGRVENLIQVYPSTGLDLGILPQRGAGSGKVRIYSSILDDFEITGVEGSVPQLTGTWTKLPPETMEEAFARSGFELDISLESTIPVGNFRGELILQTDARDRKVSVPVTANRAAPFKVLSRPGTSWSATQGMLSLGRFNAEDGRKGEAILFLIGDSDEPVEFSDITVDPSFLKVEIKRDERFDNSKQQRFDITVEFPAGSPAGVWNGERPGFIRAKTTLPDLPDFEMKLHMVAF